MSKGVIVVDMPAGCYECECSITKEWQNSMSGEHYCGIIERKVSDYWNHEPSLKPDWCPIKSLPDHKEVGQLPADRGVLAEMLVLEIGKQIGWNKCLDEILNKQKQYV